MNKIILAFCLLLFISSCVKNNPDPAWIEISPWKLESNTNATPGIAGVLTHNFTDAWVYVDGQILGVFELPAKIPILKSGNVEIKLLPTIHDNGIAATKKSYPLVESYVLNTTLEQNKVTHLDPSTRYYTATKFWIEDFSDPSIKIQEDANNSAHLERELSPNHQLNDCNLAGDNLATQLASWGPCGRINITEIATFFYGKTNTPLQLPKGSEVYLEIDYYNTNAITTGLLAINSDGTEADNVNITLNAQNPSTVHWKKIYISLMELVSHSTSANQFKISLKALLSETLAPGTIYIDNIKVVY